MQNPFPTLYALPFYVRSIRRGLPWLEDVRALPASLPNAFADAAAAAGATGGRIGFDGYLLYSVGTELAERLPRAALVAADELLLSARMIKSARELEIVRRSVAVAEQGMRAGLDACVEGAMEYEAAAAAEFAMRSAGAEPKERTLALPSLSSSMPSLSSSLSSGFASLGGTARMTPPVTSPSIDSAGPPISRSSASSFDGSAGAVM